MKTLRFVIFIAITLGLGITLNQKIGSIPPLGKFLSPFHGFWMNAKNEKIDLRTSFKSADVKDRVNIYFDEYLIPHIFAENDHDLYFALGYVQAYHRLWQMEFQLLASEGRLTELVGEIALNLDRGKRRIGLKHAAQKAEANYRKNEPEVYQYVEAYSKGVNAYINTLDYASLPIEYKFLDYEPEPWSPFKSFLFLQAMHLDLSRQERDLEHTNAIKLWGRDTFDILYPEKSDFVDPVIPAGTPFEFDPLLVEEPDVQFPLEFSKPTVPRGPEDLGSNNFMVNGEKSASGNVLLANETDLTLTHPSIWYLAHLNAPGVNVMGNTFTGTPGIIIGFNDSIAWAPTNAKQDVVDWYLIQFKDEQRDSYLYNDNWVPTKKVVEEFKIRDGESFYDTIIYTHHGPVTYDKYFPAGNTDHVNLAMRWTAHEPSLEYKAFYIANRAHNIFEFQEALQSYWSGPSQNWIVGDVHGTIGVSIPGLFPLKWQEQGKFLMDGNEITHEWSEYIPREHLPKAINPERDFVSSANQHPVDSLYPYYVYDYRYEKYRGRRINDRLRVMNAITPKDLMKLQHDNFNYNAFETLPMMLDSLDSASLQPMGLTHYNLLKSWDFFNEPESKAPTIYKMWWRKLNAWLWDEIDSAEVSLYRPDWYNTYYILKNNPEFSFIDNLQTREVETTGDLYRKSFNETVSEIEKYLAVEGNSLEWSKYRNVTIHHLLPPLKPFHTPGIHIGGDQSIVNAVNASAGKTTGPSERMVVELDKNGVKAWEVYPGSQDGRPGNPTYGAMVDDWASGNYYELLFSPTISASTSGIEYTVTIDPEK
jgi:penicillin amidase